MGYAKTRKAPGRGTDRRRSDRDTEIRRLKDLGISVAVIVVVSGLSKRQVERILAPSGEIGDSIVVAPRVRTCDPGKLDDLVARRTDRRHNGRQMLVAPVYTDPEFEDEADHEAVA